MRVGGLNNILLQILSVDGVLTFVPVGLVGKKGPIFIVVVEVNILFKRVVVSVESVLVGNQGNSFSFPISPFLVVSHSFLVASDQLFILICRGFVVLHDSFLLSRQILLVKVIQAFAHSVLGLKLVMVSDEFVAFSINCLVFPAEKLG